MVIKYLRKVDRLAGGTAPHASDYVFEVTGLPSRAPSIVSVIVNGQWHEKIPRSSWEPTAENLAAIARDFLERRLRDSTPTMENNALHLPDEEMEQRLFARKSAGK